MDVRPRRVRCCLLAASITHLAGAVGVSADEIWRVDGGTVSIQWETPARARADLTVEGLKESPLPTAETVLPIGAASTLTFSVSDGGVAPDRAGEIHLFGDLTLRHAAQRKSLNNLRLRLPQSGPLDHAVLQTAGAGLRLERIKIGFDRAAELLIIHAGDAFVTAELADEFGDATLARYDVGSVTVRATAVWVAGDAPAPPADSSRGAAGRSVGADMTFCQLSSLTQYGRESDIVGLAVATTSWNIGDQDIAWFPMPNTNHPFIVMNLYRLAEDRLEQVGQSWVKHGFYALGSTQCGGSCTFEQGHTSGEWLGMGCTDTYSAPLNGAQNGLGPRYEVNPWSGAWTFADSHNSIGSHIHDGIEHRIQAQDDDLDPALNAGAEYFVEGYYAIAEDIDVMNSAAWKPVTVSGVPGATWSFGMTPAGTLPEAGYAIDAWSGTRQTVLAQETPPVEFVSPDGRCVLAAKVTQIDTDVWCYEYALLNIDMDRQVGSFAVPLSVGAHVTSIGFHAVQHHNEPWNAVGGVAIDNAPWVANVTSNSVTFATSTNPLRWGTLYNFRFDADADPGECAVTLGMFKPGTPTTVTGLTDGPVGSPPVCSNGLVEGNEECDPPNGVTCDDACQRIPICGDGFLDGDEKCDPPDGLHCAADCQWICGDGVVQEGEDCDPPNGVSCDTNCLTIITCGDGVLSPGEDCDDGNTVGGDGCSADCAFEYHDSCFQAGTIDAGTYAFSTLAAETDGRIHTDCGFYLGRTYYDIWYRVVPPCSGDMTVDLCNAQFDSNLVIYDSCDCWPDDEAVIACDSGSCPGDPPANTRPVATVPVVEGRCYLVRIGGSYINDRGVGEMTITCDASQADAVRGGLLWDKWWAVNYAAKPTATHPLYPPVGQQSGAATHRCVECHGWDYQGADGAYASGPHYTGIGGVFGSALTASEMFDLIKQDTPPNGHGFGALGLNDYDTRDLVAFLQEQVIDTDAYIDSNGAFLGDPLWGQVYYELEGDVWQRCIDCHGFDGTQINFHGVPFPEWVGTVAVNNPWHLLHSTRFGDPGTPMPSWIARGLSNQSAADIGSYAQTTFPVNCLADEHCNDLDFCNGDETCAADTCIPGTPPPCAGGCIDCNSNGIDDRCDPYGDFTLDGDVDADDFARFAACATFCCTNGVCDPFLYADECCVAVDADRDGDVDLVDFYEFQRAYGSMARAVPH